ncbi:hypothetical protein [Morganella morganii IS15]|nr:hypothetical protein [Morganella morganii IS15]
MIKNRRSEMTAGFLYFHFLFNYDLSRIQFLNFDHILLPEK